MTPLPGLYIVATPIGNMGDITLRALEILASADAVYAEDTRNTKKLCDRHNIAPKKLLRYDDHSDAAARDAILDMLETNGAVAALVSDAGTPLIADPGFKLVREARRRGIAVYPLPGASALTAGLSVAGLPTDRFMFAGFLPPKQAARRREMQALKSIEATLVFYESPRRLADFLADAAEIFGPRDACLLRELTKLYEEALPLPLTELRDAVSAREKIYGECVVVVSPPMDAPSDDAEADAETILRRHLAHMSVKDAVALAKEQTGLPGKALYAIALGVKERGNNESL